MSSARGVAVTAVTALLFVLSSFTADAYSTGAGQCIGGMAAVGAPHMTGTAVTGPLSDGSLVVAVNNRVYDVSEINNFYVETGTDYTILIQAQDGSFRGALIRASSPDGAEFTLEPGVNGANAMACTEDGVLGVTHMSSDLKTELGATLNIAVAGTITLDVTVVQSQNSQDGSVYFYTPYTLTADEVLPDVPTVEPVDVPASPSSPFNGTTTAATPPSVAPVNNATNMNETMNESSTPAPGGLNETMGLNGTMGLNETEAPSMGMGMNETEAPGMGMNETEAPGMIETMAPTMVPMGNSSMNETMPTMAPVAVNDTNSTENEPQAPPIGTPPVVPMAPTMPKSPMAAPTAKSNAVGAMAPATTKLWWTALAAAIAL
jgi:hypothetical protein